MHKLLLAIDDVSLPFKKNVGLYMSKPTVRTEPVLEPSPHGSGAPDDSAAHFYGTVLHDEGKFRMWYYACHWGRNPDWPSHKMRQIAKPPTWSQGDCPIYQGPICYAESDDGKVWRKPSLGQVLFKGSSENNALDLPHTVTCSPFVIRDNDDPNPARRYKMVYQFFPDQTEPGIPENGFRPTIALAVSPDGLRWTVTDIPFPNQFIEPGSFIHHAGQFITHYHVMDSWAGYFAEGGTPCGRTGVVRLSTDFRYWPDLLADAFALPEPEDRSIRGMNGAYDQVHLGVGAASFGNVCVGIYGLWHNAENTTVFEEISCDFGLLVSNDGIHFREPVKGHRFIRREESLCRPVPGYSFNTVLCQGNGILNVGEETRIYHGRWRNAGAYEGVEDLQYYSGEVALATLPRDRWGALGLNPDAEDGAICSAPVTLPEPGGVLSLNAECIAGMAVTLLTEQFQAIPGFSDGRVTGHDGLDCPVEWPGQNLTDLAGRTVRVEITLRKTGHIKPRLYAMMIGCASAAASKPG